jgi:hypothetical protein
MLVNPKITDTNTTVVVVNTNTNTNTTTVNNTNVVNTTTTVVTPTPTPVVNSVIPGLLAKALTAAIAEAAQSTNTFAQVTGGYYLIQKGFLASNATYYFWQYATIQNTFNLDLDVGLKSYG